MGWGGCRAAAASKYPGAALAVPLLVARWGQWRRLLVAAGLGVLAFALASPFVLLHRREPPARKTPHTCSGSRAGWLGFEHDHATPLAFADRLWRALGPFLLVAVAGLVVALLRRSRIRLVLASFVVAYAVYLLPVNAHFDRYVLPLVPVLGAFGESVGLSARSPPCCSSCHSCSPLSDARDLTEPTRGSSLPPGSLRTSPRAVLAADPSAPRCPTGTWSAWSCRVWTAHRSQSRPRPSAPCRRWWLLVSGAVTDRVLAAPAAYPREAAFYGRLAARAPAFEALPGRDGLAGPWVRLYRL